MICRIVSVNIPDKIYVQIPTKLERVYPYSRRIDALRVAQYLDDHYRACGHEVGIMVIEWYDYDKENR